MLELKDYFRVLGVKTQMWYVKFWTINSNMYCGISECIKYLFPTEISFLLLHHTEDQNAK